MKQTIKKIIYGNFFVSRRYWMLPLLAWAIFVICSLMWSFKLLRYDTIEVARITGRDFFSLIQSVRLWNANHAGVYVLITDDTLPNPYLKDPERDIVTDNGLRLTKINPAYMTRQISELTDKDKEVSFHITSIKPLRPQNTPDEWERDALLSFEKGEQERISLVSDARDKVFRYMGVLKVERPCLRCHAVQGYKLGDVRGGISVLFHAKAIIALKERERLNLVIIHTAIFLIVSLLIIVILYQLRKRWLTLQDINKMLEVMVAQRTTELVNINVELSNEIKAHKETSDILAKSEMRLRSISESAIDAIISINSAGDIISWNPAATRMFGYDSEEVMGKPVTIIMPLRFRDRHTAGIKNPHTSGKFAIIGSTIELVGLAKGDIEIPVEISLSLWEINGERFFTGILRDISKRKEVEGSLRISEERFRSIFENSGVGIAITDKTGVIDRLNPRLEEILGHGGLNIIGKRFSTVINDIAIEESLDKLTSGKRDIHSSEHKYIKEDGSTLWYTLTVTSSSTADGNLNFVIFIVEDITERKETQERLHELTKTLEARVMDEIQKRQAKERMLIQQSKMAAMGEMISAITHQWRQPLNALGLIVQDLSEAHKFNELTDEYLHKSIGKSMELLSFMSNTIDDFRDFYKTSKRKEPFNIIKAINFTLSIFSAQFKNKAIRLTTDFKEDNDLIVYGYPNEFNQVLLNIESNAKDAINESIEAGILDPIEAEIKIEAYSEDEDVIVRIKNTGRPIPDNDLERIFDPYFTTKSDNIGTGIGLYMSRAIIEENMNGRIYAQNCEKGATFVISLRLFNESSDMPLDK